MPSNLECNWRGILSLLGVTVPPGALPASATCPLCNGRLAVYFDGIGRRPWSWCQDCAFAGDIQQLAARAWSLPADDCMRRLAADLAGAGPADDIAVRRRLRLLAREEASTEALQFATAALLTLRTENSESLRSVVHFHHDTCTKQRWDAGPRNLFGLANLREFESRLSRGKASPAGYGAGWREALVFPAWSLPGRLCGFGLLGRDANIPRDWRYRRVGGGRRRPFARRQFVRYAEAGLFMLPAALRAPRPDFPEIFAFDSALDAARLHVRQAADYLDDLPIVAWLADAAMRTWSAWDALSGRAVILWPRHLDAAAIAMARRCEGRVVICDEPAARQALLAGDPPACLRWMRDRAVPWDAALRHHAAKLAPAQYCELVADIPAWELERLGLPAPTASTGERVLLDRRGRVAFRELPDGWYRDRNGTTRVTSFTFAIEKMLFPMSGAPPLAAGVARFRNRRISFCAPEADIAADPVRFFRRTIAAAGAGDIGKGKFAGGLNLLALSRAFSAPRCEEWHDCIGWDESLGAFVFPGFNIAANGDVVPATANLPAGSPDLPCSALQDWPAAPDPVELRRVPPEFWTITLLVLERVLAPVLGLSLRRVAVLGEHEWAARCATTLGCRRETGRHRWPALFGPAGTDPRAARPGAGALAPSGAIVLVGYAEAAILCCHGDWDAAILRPPASDIPAAAANVIPHYLRDLSARRFSLAGDSVADDLRDWVSRVAGDAAAVRTGAAAIRRADAVDAGWRADILLAGLLSSPTRPPAIRVDGPIARIRGDAVASLAQRQSLVAPGLERIAALLAAAPSLATAGGAARGGAWCVPTAALAACAASHGIPLSPAVAGL